jgi:FkbM family methyltransferase
LVLAGVLAQSAKGLTLPAENPCQGLLKEATMRPKDLIWYYIKSALRGVLGTELYEALYWAFWKLPQRYSTGEKELRALRGFVKQGDIAFDIGANMGVYTYELSKLVGPRGFVYAFEPVARTASRLKRVVRLRRLTNVRVIQAAIGDTPGQCTMVLPAADFDKLHPFAHMLGDHEIGGNSVEQAAMTTVDRFCTREGTHPDFVKCDVEGAEMSVFQGALNTLVAYHPTLLCEIEARWTSRYGHHPADILVMLTNLGYEAYVLEESAASRVTSLDVPGNYLFLHRERLDTARLKRY